MTRTWQWRMPRNLFRPTKHVRRRSTVGGSFSYVVVRMLFLALSCDLICAPHSAHASEVASKPSTLAHAGWAAALLTDARRFTLVVHLWLY
jgi:hypothetical protein